MAKAINLTLTRVRDVRYDPDGPRLQRLWDAREPGLGLELYRSGRKSWIYRYTFNFKQRIIKLDGYPEISLEKAREELQERRRILRSGKDPKAAETSPTSVRALFERYAETDLPAKSRSMQENFRSCYRNHIGPVIGGLLLEEVAKTEVREVLDRLKAMGQEGSLRLTHAYLKVLFEYALERDLIPANPARVKYKLETSGIRERHLDEAEIQNVLALTDHDPATLLLKWLLLSGARLNEGREAAWEDIEDGVWTIPAARSKNRKEHKLPVTTDMQAVLDAAYRLGGGNADSDYIFKSLAKPQSPISEPYVRKLLREITSDAVPHDLRRTAATFMDAYGVPHESIKLILNHSQRGVTSSVYVKGDSMMKKRAALEKYHLLLKNL